jgi:hypothetical protein
MSNHKPLIVVVFALVIIVAISYNPAYGYLIPQPDITYPTIYGFPDPHPTATYYAWKMAQNSLRISEQGLTEPKLYDPFEINVPSVISCGDYFTISGRAPTDGVLESLALSKAEPYHITTQTYSNDFGTLGYLTIPCNEETLGEYDVYFNFYHNPQIWRISISDAPSFSETVTVLVTGNAN